MADSSTNIAGGVDVPSKAANWLFDQPRGIVLAVIFAAVACYGLYWFAKLHERTITTATGDMKSAVKDMADAFTKDQERDAAQNRDFIRDVLAHRRENP